MNDVVGSFAAVFVTGVVNPVCCRLHNHVSTTRPTCEQEFWCFYIPYCYIKLCLKLCNNCTD